MNTFFKHITLVLLVTIASMSGKASAVTVGEASAIIDKLIARTNELEVAVQGWIQIVQNNSTEEKIFSDVNKKEQSDNIKPSAKLALKTIAQKLDAPGYAGDNTYQPLK